MSLRCMLVDDSVDFLASASELLSAEGIEIVARATSARDAVALAASALPDFALVDVELGADDGVDLARHLTVSGLVPYTILISLRDRTEVIGTSGLADISGFIRKNELTAQSILDLLDSAADAVRAEPSERHETHHVEADAQWSALRRIAAVVAHGSDPLEMIKTIAHEASTVLGIEAIGVYRYRAESRMLTKLYGTHGDRAAAADGASWSIEMSPYLVTLVETGSPVRDSWWLEADNVIGERHRAQGFGESVAAPITVDDQIWGCLVGFARADQILPDGCEQDFADFANLAATAVANIQARRLAVSQAALRRVATEVAQGAEPQTVFVTVAHEASRLLGLDAVSLIRHEATTGMLTKLYGTHGDRSPIPDGTTWPLADSPECSRVVSTGTPARIDDWDTIPGPVADRHRAGSFGGSIAAPIVVGGSLWGMLAAYGNAGSMLPPNCENDLADFTTLVASAIANAQARQELRGLAERQGAALRRVATLVTQRASPTAVFDAVAMEAQLALAVMRADVCRLDSDGTIARVGSTVRRRGDVETDPTDRAIEEIVVSVAARGTSLRLDNAQADAVVRSAVGAPIRVDHDIWGVIVVVHSARLPTDIENRVADFTHLVAGSISNVAARDQLIASRARVVSASDDTRRRIERDLHDGVQQRVVSVALKLRALQVRHAMPPGVDQELDEIRRSVDAIQDEIRAFSQGLHPVLLSRSGLGPALRDLVRRSPMVVDLEVSTEARFAESVESAVYYVVSEALTNAGKYAEANSIAVAVDATGGTLRARVVDDGVGGASPERGTGLIGLVDRVEAAGGELTIDSRVGAGTTITVEIPYSR